MKKRTRLGWFRFGMLLCLSGFLFSTMQAARPLKFAILSDLHAPDIPDGKERLEAFLKAARKEKVDFIIELGDFCRLDKGSEVFRTLWNTFPTDKYHVIGNHDMDRYTAEEYVRGMGMPGRYYAFDKGGFRFIVLDGNNLFDGKTYRHYEKGNYYAYPRQQSFMDSEQVEWLKRTLAGTDKRCILFSHQSLERVIGNREVVRQVLEDENRRVGYTKVVMAFSGHDHSNYLDCINGINYMQVNSASYVWLGCDTQTEKRYPSAVNKRYRGILSYSITYDKPLYAIVTLTNHKIKVKGKKARFMPPTPDELGIHPSSRPFPLVSEIKDVVVRLEPKPSGTQE